MKSKSFYPQKLQSGDKVAILSPSGGAAVNMFTHQFELGLQRLRDVFELEPIEYPTTRKASTPEERAEDIHTALQDPEIKAIFCSIGGADQITVLRYLDTEIVKANPKIFMGYSDATNLCLFLNQIGGYVTYSGPAVLTQFGLSGAMDEYTVNYIRKALFEGGETALQPAAEYSDSYLDWSNPENLTKFRPLSPAKEWEWYNNQEKIVRGNAWGGCLEIIDFQLRTNIYLPSLDSLKGNILYFETSEEMPSSGYVKRLLMCMGERGMLQQFSAIMVGRAKAESLGEHKTEDEKEVFRSAQREEIINAMTEYNPEAPIIFDMDFGHTDPMFIVPHGGMIHIDGVNKTITVQY